MATPKPKNVYPCTMAELYTICRMGWNSFIANIIAFSAEFTDYTSQFGQDALAEVDAAEALPEFQERNEQAELALVQLKQTAKTALKKWKFLRNYIRKSFPLAERKAKWESAGSDHYEKASNQNWGELRNMLTAGSNFLTANGADLATGGMPPPFALSYLAARTAFNDALVAFTNFEQDEVEGTDLKVIANNALYHKLIDMFDDGTLIFEETPAKYERFVFAHLKEIITHEGSSSGINDILFEGTMTDQNTALPLASQTVKASISGSTEELSLVTNIDGMFKFRFVNIAADFTGSVSMKAKVLGYDAYAVTVPVAAGENYVEDIALVPSAPPPPPPVP